MASARGDPRTVSVAALPGHACRSSAATMPSRTFRRSAIGLHATTFLLRQMERADEHVLKRRRLGTL
jgi:hypothetical protein